MSLFEASRRRRMLVVSPLVIASMSHSSLVLISRISWTGTRPSSMVSTRFWVTRRRVLLARSRRVPALSLALSGLLGSM